MIRSAKQTTFCRALQSCLVLRGYPEFPQACEMKKSLSGIPHRRVSMQRPSQALGDVDTKVFSIQFNFIYIAQNHNKIHFMTLIEQV